MTGASAPPLPPARLFTTFGTVLFVDARTGELRHGPIETSPANVLLVANVGAPPSRRVANIVCRDQGSEAAVVCTEASCGIQAGQASSSDPSKPTLEVVPLERGLFGLRADGRFLCAEQDGGITLSRSRCSTWECFLGSEDWCSASCSTTGESAYGVASATIDTLSVKKCIIDPRLRMRSNVRAEYCKILIYGYPQWSHGRVYYELCKRLSNKGHIVDVLNWRENHDAYFHELYDFYDLFLTSPDGVATLIDVYGVPTEKLIVVSHSEFDIRMLIEAKGVDIFGEFAAYGVVGESVYCASIIQGVRRLPKVVPLGVAFDEFCAPPPERLATVGYASSMTLTVFGVEVKRGHLAEAAAREVGLAFKVAGWTGGQVSFHEMPDFYRSVDAILMTSISESAGLPALEAAAAGRLVIGTPVGHFSMNAYQGGGIIAPIEPDKFVAFATATLRQYKDSPEALAEKCLAIQEAARRFDWKHRIGEWVSLIDGASGRQ